MDSQDCTIRESASQRISVWPHVHVPDLHGHSRFFESRIDVIDWNGIKRVRRVAADIDDHPQPTSWASSIDLLMGHEWGYLRAQVNAIDENVNVQDLLEWSALGGFIQVPLENVVPI